MSGDSIFGHILTLNSKSATIVFIAVLVFFLLFEAVACNKRGFKGLVKKLYREFMIMGLISFSIYIASEAYDFPQDQWFSSFHFAHIVIVFIGITFLLQSALLVSLVSSRNLTLLRHANATSEELILDFVTMHKEGGLRMLLFDHGPISIPFPELREKIEYKILQQFFIKAYNLPHEFKFANYMCMVLKNYVIALVEVRPISWLIMTGFVALNYLKVAVIDPIYQHEVCKRYPGANLISEHSFHLSGSSEGTTYGSEGDTSHASSADATNYNEHVCDEYTLRYTFVVLMMIGLYLVGVLIASEVYMKRLIEIVLDQQALEDEAAAAAAATEDNTNANRGVGGDALPFNRNGAGSGKQRRRSTLRFLSDLPLEGDIEMAQRPPQTYSVSESPTPWSPGEQQEEDSGLPLDSTAADGEGEYESEIPMSMFKDRRNQYLDSLERLMVIEYDYHMDLARRMSTGEGDFMNHEAMAAAAAAAYSTGTSTAGGGGGGRQSRSLTQTGRALLGLSGGQAHSAAPHRGSDTGSFGNNSSSGEAIRARFQRMQTIGKELQEVRNREEAAAVAQNVTRKRSGTMMSPSGGRNRSPTTTAADPTASGGGRERANSKFFFIPLPSRERRGGAAGGDETTTGPAASGAASRKSLGGGGGRARGYSVEYFDMNASHSAVAPPFLTGQPQNLSGKIMKWFKCIGVALHTAAKKFGSMLIEHHIGHSKEDVSTDEDIKQLQKKFNLIFLCAQPEFYYHSVEMALLVQCVYIALWATNFVSMAQGSHFPVRWQILLVIPLPLNFFLLKQIIFTSCMLKSILSLDKFVADKICEDAVDEQNVTERLRKLVRVELKKIDPDFDKESAKAYLKEKFEQFCNFRDNGIVGVNEKHMKLYLHSLQIFLTDISISRIFSVIDFDRDGIVTWENLCRIVFPDLQQSNVKVSKRSSVRYVKRMSFDIEKVETPLQPRNGRSSIIEPVRPDATITAALVSNRRPTFDAAAEEEEEKEVEDEGVLPVTVNVARDSLLAGRRASHTKQQLSQQIPFVMTVGGGSRGSSRNSSPYPSMQRMATTDSLSTAITATTPAALDQGDVLYMTEQEETERYGEAGDDEGTYLEAVSEKAGLFDSDEEDEDEWAEKKQQQENVEESEEVSGSVTAREGVEASDGGGGRVHKGSADFVDI